MEDVTAILASPREFARRYENLQAQLDVRDSTIATLEKALAAVQSDLIHVAEQWHAAEKRTDAARAEVARLTAALTDIANEMECDGFWPVAVANIRAALRGDTAPAQPEPGKSDVEILAEYAHDAWAGWMLYVFQKSNINGDGTATIPAWAVERWSRQANTPYSSLPGNEQESDRAEARKIIYALYGKSNTASDTAPAAGRE